MTVIIIPGIHSPELTDRFVRHLQSKIERDYLVLPTEQYLPYNAIAIDQWLTNQQLSKTQPLCFIAFSAGVVGGISAAWKWQLQGGKIHSFVAFDGWGMPLFGSFPIHRVSHDYFTHWSSRILGAGENGFYADPAIEHLELWRSPEICQGWQTIRPGLRSRCSLTNYLKNILNS
ncbi:hypothetical protein IQ255_17760 [Pleurocapsales cyanobacterium LEGE 10410]|nr:hypothetical protein [Pleurocapsales cyanobacterium LEGE 10410]